MINANPCELLSWDSRFFGFPIARVTTERLTSSIAESVVDWCEQNRVRCLYFLCRPDDRDSVGLAESYQFHLVDIRVELVWSFYDHRPEPNTTRQVRIQPYLSDDRAALMEISGTAYTATRFYYDRGFTREQASSLYKEWISRECDADTSSVLVATLNDTIAGFVTCSLDSPASGRIGLLGVNEGMRGNRVGRSLVDAAQEYFIQRNIHQVRVTTQGRNVAALRLYEGAAFRVDTLHLWYHKWFGAMEEEDV